MKLEEEVKIEIKLFRDNAKIPARATDFAGGWDVSASEIEKVSDSFYKVKIGFGLNLPVGTKLTLVPRSSLTGTNWLIQNSPGLGDSDYRGEYQFRFRCIPTGIDINENGISNLTYDKFPFSVGDAIGQVYLETVIPIKFEIVDELSKTERGEGGFGSTNLIK